MDIYSKTTTLKQKARNENRMKKLEETKTTLKQIKKRSTFICSMLMVPSLHHQPATPHWRGHPLLPNFLRGWPAPGPRRQPGRPLVGDSTPLTHPSSSVVLAPSLAARPAIWPPFSPSPQAKYIHKQQKLKIKTKKLEISETK